MTLVSSAHKQITETLGKNLHIFLREASQVKVLDEALNTSILFSSSYYKRQYMIGNSFIGIDGVDKRW